MPLRLSVHVLCEPLVLRDLRRCHSELKWPIMRRWRNGCLKSFLVLRLIRARTNNKACRTPASIPIHWQEKVHADLLRDEALGVIERVPYGEPVEWCHRMVISRRSDGSPRRTVDLSLLNRHCLRETFSSESPSQIVRRIPRDSWKSVTDAWYGYHGVLEETDILQLSLLRTVDFAINVPLRVSSHQVTGTTEDMILCYLI